jgi:hypothetical protein
MIRPSPKERRLSDGALREETFGPEATPGKRGNLSFQREQETLLRQSRNPSPGPVALSGAPAAPRVSLLSLGTR